MYAYSVHLYNTIVGISRKITN